MNVLVDTCIWSSVLRRKPAANTELLATLSELIHESRVVMIGAVRQEVLSGVKHEAQFDKLREALSPFPDLALTQEDYELAARLFNQLRAKGIQGSNTDFLICAAAIHHGLAIYTNDRDFRHFALHIPVRLLET